MLTLVEENYIKALLYLTSKDRTMKLQEGVGTNDLAVNLQVKPSTVNEMLKRLNEKDLVNYEKYKKVTLTELGETLALKVIRKHRLWETFLHDKLEFDWDEVHEVAEQLEHIRSEKLIEKIDKFLDYPKYDPHGDPIPDSQGVLPKRESTRLSQVEKNQNYVVLAVSDTTKEFLKYMEDLEIAIGTELLVMEKIAYDGSLKINKKGTLLTLSQKVADNILVG
ncbi:metal-dependent transcriptional regulator [Flavobacteriaceae bacterium F89]|uniref:Transcriptional regulator MntR n=1 Tax=Cerina litoralis TaxID=2874477 RepID=A0AAE3JNW7_9FLAO|nr:metal-dependent transcriptional regulator [Cerina litoralis]MCG2460381.1 metal-dependent transcriptional regulator [Cerina litoralis]